MSSHDHHDHVSSGPWPTRRLAGALAITGSVFVLELFGGWYSHALALWADAGHMLVDVLALGLAWLSSHAAHKPKDARRTFGYRRLEVLGALVNGLLLLGVATVITYEAIERFGDPEPIESRVMMGVGLIGLVANALSLLLLRDHGDHLGAKGAFWHVLGDTLGSVGVVVAAAMVAMLGWTWVDPVLSGVLSVVVACGAVRLVYDTVDVLLESAPAHLSTPEVHATMMAHEGVADVHDLHLWSITHGMPALSAHVRLKSPEQDPHAVRVDLETALLSRFGIEHTTLQVEVEQELRCGC